MFTEVFYKLSKCVCEFWTECSQRNSLSLGANGRTSELTHTQHMHGYIYPAQHVCSKDSTDGPKDHLSTTCYTKDQHGPRRIILRGLMVEPYLSSISKDQLYPSRLSFDQNIFQMLSKSNRRMVDLVNLQHKSGHRLYQTEYRQSTDTSAPTHIIDFKPNVII